MSSSGLTRRGFLRTGLTAVGSTVVQPVLANAVFAATQDRVRNGRVLVVVQLGGGNDGLNTVVPYADSGYRAARPTLGVAPDQVLHLNDQLGLHPSLTGLKSLFDQGQVAIVQGVGYPDPVYSHFEALHVWEHADPGRKQTDGWLGKLLASQLGPTTAGLGVCALGQTSVPSELRANGAAVSVINSAATYQIQGGPGRNVAAPALYRRTPGAYGVLFDGALSTAQAGIKAVQASAGSYHPAVPYNPVRTVYGSKNNLAAALQLTAQLIVTQPSVKLCHVVLGGFDTHFQQAARHRQLLADFDHAVSAFIADIAAHGQADRVLLFSWSEFGRRVVENGSQGTDNGAAAPMFIIGKSVKGGLLGEQPSLTQTDQGNLRYAVDFRSVYQSLIADWLQADPAAVLGARFPDLRVVV